MPLPLRVNVVKRGEYASTTRSVLRSEQCVYLACQSRNHGEHVTGFNAIVGPAYLLIRIASHSYFHHSVSHENSLHLMGPIVFPSIDPAERRHCWIPRINQARFPGRKFRIRDYVNFVATALVSSSQVVKLSF